ncbi:MAG: nucleoside-diphosphate kinase [Opitutales bacterium]|nr:nucleoside-diphosphate kinase [Opitutales bacterium]
MERTLIIFKPDCIKKKLEGKVLDIFLSNGFDLKACKMMHLDLEILSRHYEHLKDKPFFPGIVDFMTSDHVMVLVFEAENAIARAREMLGPTDSTKADKGTIRGDFGTDMRMNICHASDSVESAEREIANFFLPEEIFE